jgi:hypothetical protein
MADGNIKEVTMKNLIVALFAVCLLVSEEEAGINKICIYDCSGNGYAVTIPYYKMCKMTVIKGGEQ